ncbi:hypothetical protein GWE18_07720 [Bradyrhizobium sp. CSA112]|uniref:hypothetical protein n=1 Tax=Bradyrhizobium sp. CSA112 TaxID=2699170 RepID=UPI0023B0F4C9|nr:hypothetical protein [Bradyrhizobium sp. CSA112]MDE5452757.1 hypothetical protein [Bradyrhizobium sp. CSA112]
MAAMVVTAEHHDAEQAGPQHLAESNLLFPLHRTPLQGVVPGGKLFASHKCLDIGIDKSGFKLSTPMVAGWNLGNDP